MPSALEPSTPAPAQSVLGPAAATEPRPCVVANPERTKGSLREYAEALAIALLLALVIRSFVVQAFKIPSASMYPTLQTGDHILVNKLAYGIRVPLLGTRLASFASPQRGDVIVFVYPVDPTKDFIKRVVAVAGDVVEIRDKRVQVDGQPWEDPHGYFDDADGHQAHPPRDNYGPVTVPAGTIFVLGDNRDRSYDSRFWGFVNLDDVEGKAVLIYWSWDGQDRWVRWDRIGSLIQ